DALLTLAWPSGRLDEEEWAAFAQAVHTRRWLVRDQIMPSLHGVERTRVEELLTSDAWKTVESVEDQVLAARAADGEGTIRLPDAGERWAAAFGEVSQRYTALIEDQTTALLDSSAEEADGLLFTAGWLSAGGLLALLLGAVVSWRITRSLSQRLTGLR
ncbi:histidine kinase, partial [Streptomyces sp. TRM76130]|nr:histidine kinase [Streptomyces sp. TRM76130]